jgi:hypothetical protein
MAPIVHGLENEYAGRVDFRYLDISDPDVWPLMDGLGFRSTPHFFLRAADGSVTWSATGRVDEDVLRRQLDVLLRPATR